MKHPAVWWAGALEHQEHRDTRTPARTWDLRLVPAALGAWLTGLLAVHLPPDRAAVGGILYLAALVLGHILVPILAPATFRAAARVRRSGCPAPERNGASQTDRNAPPGQRGPCRGRRSPSAPSPLRPCS